MKTINEQISEMVPQWAGLIASLIPQIDDDYRATDDPDDETPGMLLTIGFTPETEERDACWNYQTGDNSFTGGAYSHPHWAVVSIYRDSVPADVADDAAEQIGELCSQ
jgi:hypothetical protein